MNPQADAAGAPELRFAHYRVLRRPDGAIWELGRGAMGVTYKAFDERLRIDVALKVITPGLVDDPKTQALFLREARAAARVRHPNVASVVYLHTTPGNFFYAMEFIAGESLQSWLKARGAIANVPAAAIAAQMARGLEAIHAQKIVHRDLKPGNLMIVPVDGNPEAWQVKIIDFGLARAFAGDGLGTEINAPTTGFRGTALYASPEQCEERGELDGRSDLYSLGCILWEMLAGGPPFRGRTHRELLNQHVSQPAPFERLAHLPPALQALLAKLLVKNPAGRFASAADVATALELCRDPLAGSMNASGAPDLETVATPIGRGAEQTPSISRKAIAVLPFSNLSSDKENEYFADGVQEEILTNLSRIRDLKVISRTSVMGYRGTQQNVREIARELGVGTVVEGSVRRSGNRVRVSAQLVDATSDENLWSENFDSELTDIFAIQGEIARKIAEALEARLSPGESACLSRDRGENAAAYDLYLRGLASFRKYRKEDNERAIGFFKQAIEIDSNFARAYAGLAEAYAIMVEKFEAPAVWQETAIAMAEKAIAMDPRCEEAYSALGTAYMRRGWNRRARAAFERALEINPNLAPVFMRLSLIYLRTGHWDEAWKLSRRGIEIEPEVPYHYVRLAEIYFALDEVEAGERWMRRAMAKMRDPFKETQLEIQIAYARKEDRRVLELFESMMHPSGPDAGSAETLGEMPGQDPPGYFAAMACVRQGDLAGVRRLVDAALRFADPDGLNYRHILLTLAWLQRREKRDPEMRETARRARELFQRAIDSGDESPQPHLNIAWCEWALGNFAACDRALDEAVRDYPLLPEVGQKDTRLDLLEYPKFAGIMSDLHLRMEEMRPRIRKLETRYP